MHLSKPSLIIAITLTIAAGCGDSSSGSNIDSGPGGPVIDGSPGSGTDGGNNPGGDGSVGNPTADAAPGSGACSSIEIQCSNCIDDDEDGLIDGFDPHCISAADKDEFTFATGISGDNIDRKKQDCFFDGNSGAGANDGCDLHTCCLLDECPSDLDQNFDRATDCPPVEETSCAETCLPATPPGCDCFGCCTICNDSECYDVLINPAVAPNCDLDVLGDPTQCPTCTKIEACNTECDPTSCILCPGQTEEDLPAECNNQNQCPEGRTSCESTDDCGGTEYCSAGCCTPGIIVE